MRQWFKWFVLFVFFLPSLALADRGLQVDALWNGLKNLSGKSLNGGKVYTYLAGTSTAAALYTALDKSGSATNPIILDANGQALVYGDGVYKFVVKDSNGTTLYTMDNLLYQTVDDLTSVNAGTSTGSSNTYAIAPSPALTAYSDGLQITWISNFANTAAATLNVNGLGAIGLKRPDGTALSANDIVSGQIVNVIYIAGSPGTFRIMGQSGITPVLAGGTGASTAATARTNLGLGTTDTPEFSSLVLGGSSSNIFSNTSDASDTKSLQLGNASGTRGSYIILNGNEQASTPGQVLIHDGDVSGSLIGLTCQNAACTIGFATGNTSRWLFDASGHFEPFASNTYDIGTSSLKVRNINIAGAVINSNATWTPTVTPSSGAVGSLVIDEADVQRIGSFNLFRMTVHFSVTSGSPTSFTISTSSTGIDDDADDLYYATCTDAGAVVAAGCRWRYGSTAIYVQKSDGSAFSGAVTVNIIGSYRAV